MRKASSLLLVIAVLFSFSGCVFLGSSVAVENKTVSIKSYGSTPTFTLDGVEIEDEEFYQKLLQAIDSKEIKSAPQPPNELCKCDIKYSVKMVGTYAKSYYFDFHTHGVEISSTCRFRKCIDILGIVEVDRETMSELIAILEEV